MCNIGFIAMSGGEGSYASWWREYAMIWLDKTKYEKERVSEIRYYQFAAETKANFDLQVRVNRPFVLHVSWERYNNYWYSISLYLCRTILLLILS